MSPIRNINLESGFVEMAVLMSARRFRGDPPHVLSSAIFNQLYMLFGWLGVVCVERTDSLFIVRLLHESGSRSWKINR